MRRTIFLLAFVFSLLLGAWAGPPQNPRVIRVGFYENPPKIYTDDSGAITGFWPELLRVIAAEHGWQIEWVPGTWSELLVMLETRQIDILPDTLWTEPRAQRFAFNEETVLVSWTRVYTRPGQKIESLLDLEGKRIGALRGSANLEDPEGLRDLLTRLQINAEIVEMDDYQAIFAALEAGQLDAAITNKDFGQLHESSYRVVRTPIIMQPVRILFAFPKDAPGTPQLIRAIDQSLAAMKADPDSAYYRLQDEFLGRREVAEETALPAWLRTALLVGGGLLLFFLAVGIVAQIQVRARTRALRESEEKFARAFQTSPDSINITRLSDGLLIEANEAFPVITGYTLEEAIGKKTSDLELWADPADRDRMVAALQKDGFVKDFEFLRKRKDGQVLHTSLSARIIEINGEPHLISIIRDIHAQKMAEAELAEKHRQLQAAFQRNELILQTTLDGYILADTQGNIRDVNPAYCQMTGYSREELLGMNINDIEAALSPEEVAARIAQFQAAGRARFHTQHRAKDGRRLHLDASVAMIQDEGEPLVAAFVRDITEQVEAEQALQESEEKFRLLFESMPVAVLFTRLEDGTIRAMNDAAIALTGYSREEALGKTTLDLGVWSDPAERQKLLEAVQKNGVVQHHEIHYRRKDGEIRLGSVSAVMMSVNGEAHMLTATEDISERRRMEEELQTYREHLEDLVAQRTAEIEKLNRGMLAMLEDLQEANRRYEQASKELQAANAELKAFTYSVSHDLKAPLRGIDGYSRLLLEDYYDQLDEDGRFFLENIRQAARQMNQLIEDLLAYSRMERRTLAPQPLALQGLVEGLLLERRIDIQERGTQIVLDLACDEVIADREGLTAALRNLIDNAIKFSAAAHPPRVEIGCRPSENGWLIWVRDNGIGFDMSYKERIFEIFQRLHPPDAYPGTGIGLAIVQKAVQRMGGRAWAESVPGEGATFYLEIPAGDAVRGE